MIKQIYDNEIYLFIKYIKSFLWRIAKRLSYIEDARCLKVNGDYVCFRFLGAFTKLREATSFVWSVCLFCLSHETTRLPLDGFL